MNNQWTDIMVDVETTGTDLRTAAIIQLSAIMFNLSTGEIGPEFDACLRVPLSDNYIWDTQTLTWWLRDTNRKSVFEGITARMEDPRDVIYSFIRWNRVNGSPTHFWSKPSHFDYNLLSKYFKDYGFENPFKYWKARDMRSYMLGLVFPDPLPDLRLNSSDAHNALADVRFQINELIKLTKETRKGL